MHLKSAGNRLALGLRSLAGITVLCSTCSAADTTSAFDFRNPPDGTNEAIPVSLPVAERIIGTYADGCILGAKQFPESTAGFELMNTVRNHQYAHSSAVNFVDRLGSFTISKGWGKLRVGDSSCPCGGKMGEGHSSHRVGLDIDIFYKFVPSGKSLSFDERNSWDEEAQKKSEIAVYEQPILEANRERPEVRAELTNEFRPEYLELVKTAANSAEIDRIFVSPPIKRKLCETFKRDNNASGEWHWLRKIRPWQGHKSHFHVRLKCPSSDSGCVPQAPIPEDPTDKAGVGCEGDSFAAWFKPRAKDEKESSEKPNGPTENEKKCQAEIAKFKQFSPATGVRCLSESEQSPSRCRNYANAATFTSNCSRSEIEADPKRCLPETANSTGIKSKPLNDNRTTK